MKLLPNPPETPINEDWVWQTDVIVSTDGSEQRISLTEFPKRTINVTLGLDSEEEVAAVSRTLMLSGDGLKVPFYQAATRLTAGAAIGAVALAFNAGRTDLRSGGEALIFDRSGAVERVTLAVVSSGGSTLTGPLARAWSRRASIAPVWPVYSNGSLAMTRRNPDYFAEVKIALTELNFIEPFDNEFAEFELPVFGNFPVLLRNAVGSEFEQSYDTGSQTIGFGQRAEIRNLWLHAQVVMPRQFLCQRVLEPSSWAMWRKLADYAKGSANPFYVPTFRQDFPLLAVPIAGAVQVTFKGDEYAEDFAPFEPFRQLAFFLEDGGVHYAAVSNCVLVGGNSRATFAPAIPNGAVVRKVSLLLKVRIADDRISCEHNELHTMLTINLRTAD